MTVDALTVTTVYSAAVTIGFGILAAVVVLQWRRIGRLCARIREQNEGAMEMALQHADELARSDAIQLENERLAAENTVLRAENARHLALAVGGPAT